MAVGSAARQAPLAARHAVVDSRQAWLIAVAGLLANAACWGTLNSFGAFLPSMTSEFGGSLGATALIYALPSFILFMAGLLTGQLTGQFGPRRVIFAGAALIGAGLYITSRANTLAAAVAAYGLGVGLGMACFLVPMTACIGGWFVRRRAAAQGLSAAGSGVGSLVLVPLARWLIDNHGWRRAYQVLAVICVGALALAATVASRPPNQATLGRFSLRKIREATAKGPFLRTYVGGFLITASLYVPFAFVVRYATSHGISRRNAAFLLSILGASNIVSRLATTSIAGRFGASRVYLVCFATLPLALALWLGAGGSYLALGLFTALLGVSHGGYVALSPEVTANLFGVANIGVVLGALWTSSGVAGLLSPVLAGTLIDHRGYSITIVAALVLSVLSVIVQRSLWNISAQRSA